MRLGLDDATFGKILAEELYVTLKAEAGARWPAIVECLEAASIGARSKATWLKLTAFFEGHAHWRNITAVSLAATLAETLDTDSSPTTILSFNAEPLLFALINSYIAKRSSWSKASGFTKAPKQQLDKLTRALSNRERGRLPYVFCHGLLPVLDGGSKHANVTSLDKLVFSESQYLGLANILVSWQATTFVETCMSRQVIFVGVSLSDANMRHWLSRVAQNKRQELSQVFGHDGDFVSHYWINRWPGNDAHAKWVEETVGHLGVKVVWIDDWRETDKVLRRGLGLS